MHPPAAVLFAVAAAAVMHVLLGGTIMVCTGVLMELAIRCECAWPNNVAASVSELKLDKPPTVEESDSTAPPPMKVIGRNSPPASHNGAPSWKLLAVVVAVVVVVLQLLYEGWFATFVGTITASVGGGGWR